VRKPSRANTARRLLIDRGGRLDAEEALKLYMAAWDYDDVLTAAETVARRELNKHLTGYRINGLPFAHRSGDEYVLVGQGKDTKLTAIEATAMLDRLADERRKAGFKVRRWLDFCREAFGAKFATGVEARIDKAS
jgi:hypothetical protein